MSSTPIALAPAEMAASILEGFSRFIESEANRARGGRHEYVYAGSWRECTRQMALEMLNPEMLPPFSIDTLANLRRGKDRERDLLADLMRAGRNSEPSFEVIGREERFELRDRKGRVVIVGKVDARIKTGRIAAPLEVKSWSQHVVSRIETFDDLFENRWTRPGAHQLLSYLFGSNTPFGFLLLDRNGLPFLLPVELDKHLHRLEDFLTRAEIAKDSFHRVVAGAGDEALPKFTESPEECRYCGFHGSRCQPPAMNAGAKLIVDETWIQKIERWHATLEAGQEHASLDKAIKKKLRGIDMAIAGGFLLEGKWQPDTKYDQIPEDELKRIEEIRDKYARNEAKGKFFLTITKV